MKSSTHNLPNIQTLRADKRFEALVKRQEGEHKHIIASHHNEMQTLRDTLNLAVQKLESLYRKNEQELNDFKTQATDHIRLVKDRMVASDAIVAEQKKTIESFNKQLNEFHESYASKIAVEKLKCGIETEIKTNTMSHINSFQEFQREFRTLIHSLQNDLAELRCSVEKKIAQLTDRTESNFSISRMEKDGVLKEIRKYEKTIFVIEKKIENIYTLIERINKRGEACHKPE